MKQMSLCLVVIGTQYFMVSPVLSAGKSISVSDFTYLVKEPTNVDKTLLVKGIVQDLSNTIVITAPRGFGKTSNLEMLKAFFQVEVDKKGMRVTSVKDMTKPVKDTPNFKLFQQTKIMKISSVMNKHFGKHPVIQMDLKHVIGFQFLNETQNYFKEVLHETISEHSYLKDSENLDDDEREFIRVWSSEEYKSEDMETLIPGLEKLSKCLFKHFDRSKVLVLIDHYDSPILYCVTHPNIAQDAFNYVVNMIQAFFSIPKDDFYVDTFLLTGVLQVEEAHVSNAKVIKRYQFLREHKFVPFFGFTDDEVFDLLGRYAIEVEHELVETVRIQYGGYGSLDNISMYNPWAVLNYLDSQNLEHSWVKRNEIPNLQALLKIPDVHKKLEKMLKGVPAAMKRKRTLSAESLRGLRDLLNNSAGRNLLRFSTLFYSYLFDRGFLAYDSSEESDLSDEQRCVIPNEEAKTFLWGSLNE